VKQSSACGRAPRQRAILLAALAAGLLAAAPAAAQQAAPPPGEDLVSLDFEGAELADVIDAIAQMTKTNFIYDDRVRGRVTIVSPEPMTVDQAYAVFESVLQVKGFTTVRTPGGALKVIPVRDAKESNIETGQSARPPSNRDLFVTRLIPLRYIEAASIVETLKPLVSKDAAMAAYEPTNTVILTESASNIRRIMSILDSIDVETYKEELTVIRVEYADAGALADQISEIYGTEAESAGAPARGRRARRRAAQQQTSSPTRGKVRILTDERTNSLLVLAARATLEDVRDLVRKLDVPVSGGGRIHVYYLNHANAEELAQTLNSLISGRPRTPAAGGGAGGAAAAGQGQALRAVVTELAEGIAVTADPATNALVIQASQEGFSTIRAVIEKLDVQRPQVLVEALIMEVDVTDSTLLGMNVVVQLLDGDPGDANRNGGAGVSGSDSETSGSLGDLLVEGGLAGASVLTGAPFLLNLVRQDDNSLIQGIIRASASDSGTNILSAPHILTSDNEQAEIRIGNNIPIISSRVQSAAGVEQGLSTSVNVERQDVGVTLRVTPQITEGNTLRMEIFQEITAINSGISSDQIGAAEDVGVPLSNRRVENTVVVEDGETVVIGGLISENFNDKVTKVPFLGDIPFLGWLFKTVDKEVNKVNLLVFLTPHIIRESEDLELETIRKREEFAGDAAKPLKLNPKERERIAERRREAAARGEEFESDTENPVRSAVLEHETRYPVERMAEIEADQRLRREAAAAAGASGEPRYFVQAAVLRDEQGAVALLTELVDAGWDGTLITADAGDGPTYEIRLGPYASLEESQRVAEAVGRAERLQPSVLVAPPEEAP
jgi:general secretion pathway protein D